MGIEIRIDESLRRDPALLAAVERGTKYLLAELGTSKMLLSAAWSRAAEGVASLTLSTGEETLSETFSSDVLQDEYQCRKRVNRLFMDLLEVRTDRLFRNLDALIQSAEGR